ERAERLDVADEVEVERLDLAPCLADLLVPLSLLLAVRQESDARTVELEDGARVRLAEDGELAEVDGLAVDVGAEVEEHELAAVPAGHDRRERGAIDARERPQHVERARHRGAGV